MIKFFSKNKKNDEVSRLIISDSLKKNTVENKSRLKISPSLKRTLNLEEKASVITIKSENKVFENKRDILFLEKYIDSKEKGKNTNNAVYGIDDQFLSEYGSKFNAAEYLSHTFNDGGSGITITYNEPKGSSLSLEERKYRAHHDFRITLRSTKDLSTEEAISFTKAVINEANKRGLALGAKNFLEHDFLILYLDKEHLSDMIDILEKLKDESKFGMLVSNATKHFGNIQPFSATISDSPYYGISMAHPEPRAGFESRLSSFYGATGEGATFNGYMSKIVDDAYDNLIKTNKKVNPENLYDEIVKQHNLYMLGVEQSDLPLWMNRRNYMEYKNNIAHELSNNEFHK